MQTITTSALNNLADKLFALIQFALGAEECAPQVTQEEWSGIYLMAEQQALLGVTFIGIKKLKEQCDHVDIPKDLLLKWIFVAEQIKRQNMLLNQRAAELVMQLKKDGFDCCILKGQGNALMYPNPYSRTPGDIDVWSTLRLNKDEEKHKIIDYAKKDYPDAEVRVYHVEYEWKGVPVELHFMPGIMNNPLYNRRIQRWYTEQAAEQFGNLVDLPDGVGSIPVPTTTFNVVYQLTHLMHHYFDEGIGLRQFVDYYYVLKDFDDRESLADTLKYLNLYHFAGAVMYIEKEVLGLEEKYLIVEPDEKRGKTLLREILEGGNFGRSGKLDKHSTSKKYFQKTWRNMRLAKEYPAEALCEPFFRTWHFLWRLAHK